MPNWLPATMLVAGETGSSGKGNRRGKVLVARGFGGIVYRFDGCATPDPSSR